MYRANIEEKNLMLCLCPDNAIVSACSESADRDWVSYLCTENIPVWSLSSSANELIFFSFLCRLFFLSSLVFFLVTDLKFLVTKAFLQLTQKPTQWYEQSGRETVLPHSALSESDGGRKKRDPHNLSPSNPYKQCPLPPILLYFIHTHIHVHTQKHTL